MIENVKTHNETITIYTRKGITYNGKRETIKSLFDTELKEWHSTKKKKRS